MPCSPRSSDTGGCWPDPATGVRGWSTHERMHSKSAITTGMPPRVRKTSEKRALERLRERIATRDRGWFFAQIAEKVTARRGEMGLSQRELAELVGTTQSAIARLERGGRPPRIDTLLNIADALDCDLVVELRPKR